MAVPSSGTSSPANSPSVSYNFNSSKNENQTFDVATYGNSANGTEGPSKINLLNLNLFTAVSATRLNECHVTMSRESRPRSATPSNIPADTGIGFGPSFRFGDPFFLAPNIDERVTRFQLKDNFTMLRGQHTIKAGGSRRLRPVRDGVLERVLRDDSRRLSSRHDANRRAVALLPPEHGPGRRGA